MNVCVVGLGKLGLPLAVQIAAMGHRVIGVDINQATVDLVNAGTEPFPGEAELQERLSTVIADGNLSASVDTASAVSASESVIILVPLVVDADRIPDFGALDAATKAVSAGLRPGTLVSYETTLPVGTTRGRFAPMLATTSGLSLGRDLFVVHSPERVFTGRVFADLRKYPKLVGGVDPASTKRGVEFYESILEFDERPDLDRPNGVWAMSNVETAELTKLAETTYRSVNIGLANEFARYAEGAGINVTDVIQAANSQVFSHIHLPGASVGGHCIPVYPHLYMLNDFAAQLPRLAVEVNESMPAHLVDRLDQHLPDGVVGKRVGILGLAYRGGVKEDAFSGTYPLAAALRAKGATVVVDDPMYDDAELSDRGLSPMTNRPDVDALVLHTSHRDYADLTTSDFPNVTTIVDGRNFLRDSNWDGVDILVIGQAAAHRHSDQLLE